MIIGPLLRDQVEELLKSSPTVPVLALNELDKPIVNDNTFYFALRRCRCEPGGPVPLWSGLPQAAADRGTRPDWLQQYQGV